jgi:hypothetical protein
MELFALALVGISVASNWITLPCDVAEIQTRRFQMPLSFNEDRKEEFQGAALYASTDRGTTWTHVNDYKVTDKVVTYFAPCDGEYWFALHVKLKDGKTEPAALASLTPAMKVYVNAGRKRVRTLKSETDLQAEVDELQKTVKRLEKRINEFEAVRKP